MQDKIVTLVESEFRHHFGLTSLNHFGFFLSRVMSHIIHDYADWIDYIADRSTLVDEGASTIEAALVSTDGYWLYTGDRRGRIMVRDLSKNEIIHQRRAHKRTVNALAYHHRWLVSAGDDFEIRLWNAYTMDLCRTFYGHSDSVFQVWFTEKGDEIVSCSHDQTVRVWNLESGRCVRVLTDYNNCVIAARSKSDSIIVTGDLRGSLKLWHLQQLSKQYVTLVRSTNVFITGLHFNCNGSRIAMVGLGRIVVYSWPQCQPEMVLLKDTVKDVCFHPLNPDILAVSDACSVQILNVSLKTYILTFQDGGEVSKFCFTPDGSRLVSTLYDRTSWVWDTSTI